MFDGLLKSKFYSRCKTEIKQAMKRIEMIRRKRNAMQKFLRNDVADLIKTGLDSNAFDRVEQLYADQNLSWCYEYVEQSCLLVLSELSVMNKQRECPEQCKVAVSTLMFAAAIFADLPELRELRSLFAERYGNDLEPYVNQQFVMSLKAAPPTKDIKFQLFQLMQEIALEYGINWDSKALEQKLYKPPPLVQDWSKYTNGRNNESVKSHHQNDLGTNIKKETEKEKQNKPTIEKNLPYRTRAEIETKKEEKHDHGRLSPCWSSNASSSSESATSPDDSASEDIPQGRKFYGFKSMAPPYIITESTKKSTETNDDDLQSGIPEGRKCNELRSTGPPYIKPDLSKKTAVNDDSLKSEDDISKQIPISMRIRRPLKQAAGSSRGDNDALKTSATISNGENNFVDEEEKKMDKLLAHYSSRKTSHVPAPKRSGSLPSEPVAAHDERRGLTRAATYQQDSRGHVHPKLPDYDDFVARLAAFRASS